MRRSAHFVKDVAVMVGLESGRLFSFCRCRSSLLRGEVRTEMAVTRRVILATQRGAGIPESTGNYRENVVAALEYVISNMIRGSCSWV